jgi:benzylsuccinate CoA-transferase BbsF subunit
MFISEYIMDAISNGREGGRIGNRHPYRAPQGCYPARGHDQWITLSVAGDQEWRSLCALMGREELARDSRYADLLSRQQNHDRIDGIISAWTRDRDRYDLMHLLQGAGIAAGPVLNSKDVHLDPQYQSRNFLERVEFPPERRMGARILMGRPFKFANTPMKIRWPAPEFGEGNAHFLKGLLGVDEETYQDLVQDAIIASVPTSGEPAPAPDPREALARGQIADWDPDYRQRLGLS